MQEHSQSLLLESLRRLQSDGAAGDPVESMVGSIRALIVRAGMVGPIKAIACRAMGDLVGRNDQAPLGDDELIQVWLTAVENSIQSFGSTHRDWEGEDVDRFRDAISRCFGVDLPVVPVLLDRFFEFAEGSRFAVLASLTRSESFDYMHHEILAMGDEMRMDSSPAQAVRRLMQQTFASA